MEKQQSKQFKIEMFEKTPLFDELHGFVSALRFV